MTSRPVVVVGGGPAGLMAAETLRAAGLEVELRDHLASVGRKILIAGKGGLNLTHSEPTDAFIARYREAAPAVARWLAHFDAGALRDWCRGLGIDTIIGSSGRVFPADLRAAPLLRGWVRRLREQGVHFRLHSRWLGWDDAGRPRFARVAKAGDGDPPATERVDASACILALGGGSWPVLGSDGHWVGILREAGVDVASLVPANCGFEVRWSPAFRERFAGTPVKPVALALPGALPRRGEFVVTAAGVEGSLLYALSAPLREAIARDGRVVVQLDLDPARSLDAVRAGVARPRGRRSVGEHLRRTLGLDGVRLGLLHECARPLPADPAALAACIKSLPLELVATRPIEEAISSAGGVRLAALDDRLMLRARPGVFCAGEMLDWEAPTGGYLLTACMASGRHAALGAIDWLRGRA